MNKALISLMITIIFFVGSCGNKNENSIPVGSLGFPCIDIGDGVCVDDLVCEDGICVVDESANTGDTGNTGNTGDSGNTEESGNTCTGSDKFCHSHDGLNWSDASGDEINWDEGASYCKNLGGRLPTVSELRTLIQNCPGTETSGECGVTDNCLSFADCWNHPCFGCEYDESGKYSVFGDADILWSSSEQSDNADCAWYVSFNDGRVYGGHHDNSSVRCVK